MLDGGSCGDDVDVCHLDLHLHRQGGEETEDEQDEEGGEAAQ